MEEKLFLALQHHNLQHGHELLLNGLASSSVACLRILGHLDIYIE
jgi:hypothetical protein